MDSVEDVFVSDEGLSVGLDFLVGIVMITLMCKMNIHKCLHIDVSSMHGSLTQITDLFHWGENPVLLDLMRAPGGCKKSSKTSMLKCR